MKYILLNLLLLMVPLGAIHAQIPEAPKALPSPTAAGLGLYGEIPVSYFTGTPSIQIPLYELLVDQHKLPLSLNYHASGVRPDQHGSWTGLGWNLNAGGVISRVVKDMPDEYNNPRLSYGKQSGYYFTHSVLNTPRWNQRSYLRQVAQNTDQMIRDTEPDIFSFNFLNYSGKFMLTHEGKWKVQCDKPVTVEFHNKFLEVSFDPTGTKPQVHGNTPCFEGFTLTAEDGTQYVFGCDDKSIEYSIEFFAQTLDEWTAVSWFLTEIVYTNGEKITFTYERDCFVSQMYISAKQDLFTYMQSTGGFWQQECHSSALSPNIDNHYSGKLISPVYLVEINTPDMRVELERYNTDELRYEERVYRNKYEAGAVFPFLETGNATEEYLTECLRNLQWCFLSSIYVYDKGGDTALWFHLSYKNQPTDRLMLESVTEYGYDYKEGGRVYRFEYEQPEKLPGYLSNKVDHWGFFNNKEAVLNPAAYYNLREPNSTTVQYGTLNKIIYPTGGYTRFVFEPHEYRKQLSDNRWEACNDLGENKIAGGLRIKRIIDSATGVKADEKVSKEYFYTSDYVLNRASSTVSSGVLGGLSHYYFSDYEVEDINGERLKHQKHIFSSQSVLPACENSMGSHIGYTEVVEKRADGAFTRYCFTNFDNGHLDEPADAIIQLSHTPYEPYSSTSEERGRLILQEEYTAAGVLKRKKELSYVKSSDSPENFVRSMKALCHNLCSSAAMSYDEGSAYRIYMYNYRLAAEKDTLYDNPAAPLATTISYEYNAAGLLRKKTQSVNAGLKSVSYKYPADCTTAVCRDMAGKHVLSPVVEEKMEFSTGTLTYPLQRNCYSYIPLKGGTPRYFGLEKMEQSIGTGALKEKLFCHRHDAKGNMVHLTENQTDVVYLWGYNYMYVVAEIRNATVEQVERYIGSIESFSSADTPDLQKLALLRKYLGGALITTYTHTPIGITSITDSQGKTVYFQYDRFGRLAFERDYQGKIRKTYDYRYSIK